MCYNTILRNRLILLLLFFKYFYYYFFRASSSIRETSPACSYSSIHLFLGCPNPRTFLLWDCTEESFLYSVTHHPDYMFYPRLTVFLYCCPVQSIPLVLASHFTFRNDSVGYSLSLCFFFFYFSTTSQREPWLPTPIFSQGILSTGFSV